MGRFCFFTAALLVSVCALGQDIDAGFNINVRSDGHTGFGAFFEDNTYQIESPTYSLGAKRYNTRTPLMRLSKDESKYHLIVIIPMKDAEDAERFHTAGVLRHITLYTSEGNSVILSYGSFSLYTWTPESRGLTGMVGIRDYRMSLGFDIDDIEDFLSREYVGYDIAGGYRAEDFKDDAKRVRSFNRNLHTAKRVLDKRVRNAFKTRHAGKNPDL